MRRALLAALVLPAVVGLAAAGYRAGQLGVFSAWSGAAAPEQRADAPAGRVLYYRHPDRPEYAPEPRRTANSSSRTG